MTENDIEKFKKTCRENILEEARLRVQNKAVADAKALVY
jgi:hypothetical protein